MKLEDVFEGVSDAERADAAVLTGIFAMALRWPTERAAVACAFVVMGIASSSAEHPELLPTAEAATVLAVAKRVVALLGKKEAS